MEDHVEHIEHVNVTPEGLVGIFQRSPLTWIIGILCVAVATGAFQWGLYTASSTGVASKLTDLQTTTKTTAEQVQQLLTSAQVEKQFNHDTAEAQQRFNAAMSARMDRLEQAKK